jgi:mannose-6-phosphate isomerase-like protein (cupin superfamily)
MGNYIDIINANNAVHYFWGEKCDGWHLVNSDNLSIIKEKMPPGTAEIKHYHQKSRQFFYILSGTAEMEVKDKYITLTASDGIEIPPLIPHRIFNNSHEDLIFLVISQPKSHGDRVLV